MNCQEMMTTVLRHLLTREPGTDDAEGLAGATRHVMACESCHEELEDYSAVLDLRLLQPDVPGRPADAAARSRSREADCDRCREMIPRYVDREILRPAEPLPSGDRRVERHLAACAECREIYEGARDMALSELPSPLPAPHDTGVPAAAHPGSSNSSPTWHGELGNRTLEQRIRIEWRVRDDLPVPKPGGVGSPAAFAAVFLAPAGCRPLQQVTAHLGAGTQHTPGQTVDEGIVVPEEESGVEVSLFVAPLSHQSGSPASFRLWIELRERETGKALAGVPVKLRGPGGAGSGGTTDAKGRYPVSAWRPGEGTLQVTCGEIILQLPFEIAPVG